MSHCGIGDMWCKQCRNLESYREPVSPGLETEERAADDPHTCERCGALLTAEDQNELLSRRLQKFGLLDDAGTVLEKKARRAVGPSGQP